MTAQPDRAGRRLPRRDLWLLPLISLLTLAALLALSEAAARLLFPEQLVDACKVPDATLGKRYLPNCTATLKAAEGPWVTSHYDEHGYRTAASAARQAPPALRAALIGTSVAQGYLLAYEQTAGATMARQLSLACHQAVDVANIGSDGFSSQHLLRRVRDALALHPVLVLLMVGSHDLSTISATAAADAQVPDEQKQDGDALHRAMTAIKGSRAVTVMRHFLTLNPDLYLPLYLASGDQAGFLHWPPLPAWQQRLEQFDTLLDQMHTLTQEAGIPLAIVYVPQEAQAMLVKRAAPPPGIDPLALGADIARRTRAHGVLFHDATTDFKVLPNPQDAYYAVDGHISGLGQSIIGADLARQFASQVPGFAACASQAPAGR